MRRETTNKIRYILEDLIPPIVRDSQIFRMTAKLFWGEHFDRLTDFRSRATYLTPDEYASLYRDHPRVHQGTDNSDACVDKIIDDCRESESICDIGCGTGELLRRIRERLGNDRRYIGVDFVIEDAGSLPGIGFVAANIERLPFDDGAFDTVVCTHTLEHILDLRGAVSELRRIARRQIITVVPCEREYRYTFNPHFNFFPYPHSFLKVMHPSPQIHKCELIGRDIYYREEKPQV